MKEKYTLKRRNLLRIFFLAIFTFAFGWIIKREGENTISQWGDSGKVTGKNRELGTDEIKLLTELLEKKVDDLEQRAVSIGNFPLIIPESDDSPRIQRAIDRVFELGGGIVFIPRGTYTISTPIQLRNYVSLHGAGGRHTRLKKKAGSLGNIIEYKQEDTSYIFNITIKDFAIFGTGETVDVTNNGLVLNHYWGIDGAVVENIIICDCGGTGLIVEPSPVNTLESEKMVLQQSMFKNINIEHCGNSAYIKGFVGNVQWDSCTFDWCIGTAFESRIGENGNGPQDNTFINCSFQHAKKGFHAVGHFINVNFYGCHFENNTEYGVHINTSSTGNVNFDGTGFYTCPSAVYFEKFSHKASFRSCTWKALTPNSVTERFIKVNKGLAGIIFIDAGQHFVNSIPTKVEDPSYCVRGFIAMDTVYTTDVIKAYKSFGLNVSSAASTEKNSIFIDSDGVLKFKNSKGIVQALYNSTSK